MSDKTIQPVPHALPAHANLEHLKKEAKEQLRALRQQYPQSKLSAAQLAVARSYGFASWPKLRAYVEALHDMGQRLVNAVREADLETISAVLDRHPALVNATTDLNQPIRPSDALAMRLIHLAIAENRLESARLLVRRGANVNVRNANGRLPLHDCFELGRDEFKQVLFDGGASPDVCAAAAYGMHDILRQILDRDPRCANDLSTGESPLGWATYGHQPESARILLEYGAIVNRAPFDSAAWGPVSMLASTDFARILLDHGADPNTQNEAGDTPLHRVIKSRIVRNPTKFVDLLLNSGALPAILNKEGRTPLDEALAQAGKVAESYFPARPIGAKNLEQVIELLSRGQKPDPENACGYKRGHEV
ncbi:MAG TPA: ankyrin repeat domain-containing protein [Blastocatellia bacterium]|nr:ankyrin repeat domain-containing protein [Blastocatellia bacterium]